jgi:hypothetical protein
MPENDELQPNESPEFKCSVREQAAQALSDFLASGRTITQCPPCTFSDDGSESRSKRLVYSQKEIYGFAPFDK